MQQEYDAHIVLTWIFAHLSLYGLLSLGLLL